MKKIKIGIPQALMYYENYVLWKNYFEHLNCKIVKAQETNEETIQLGINNTPQNSCLPYQIFIGHTIILINECDYILFPKIYNYGKNNYTCPLFQLAYDHLKQLIPESQILSYSIDYNCYQYEFIELFKIGLKLTKNPLRIIISYLLAKKKQKNSTIAKQNEQKNKLSKSNPKVLLVGKPYILNDNYLIGSIKNYLEKNNIISINSSHLDSKTAILFSSYFSNNLKLDVDLKILGALYYYKYQIDGIIYLSSNNCLTDSLIYDLVIKENKQLPYIKIALKEPLKPDFIKFINEVKNHYHQN